MTRSQVRAAMRRMRDHHEEAEEEHGEINLVPYMDIVTNIIIFLLASVVNQVALGNINVSVPHAVQRRRRQRSRTSREKPPLNLTVSRRRHRASPSRRRAACCRSIPQAARPASTTTTALTAKLQEIKAAPDNADETKVNFNADATIPYDIVVATLDAMRQDDDGKVLFPDVPSRQGFSDADADESDDVAVSRASKRHPIASPASWPSPTSSRT